MFSPITRFLLRRSPLGAVNRGFLLNFHVAQDPGSGVGHQPIALGSCGRRVAVIAVVGRVLKHVPPAVERDAQNELRRGDSLAEVIIHDAEHVLLVTRVAGGGFGGGEVQRGVGTGHPVCVCISRLITVKFG